MKYMTFRASCSYAGLANLLSFYDIDTEDRKIALKMGLPYLFAFEDGQYCAGPMLQGAEWFNLYLHPMGFNFTEHRIKKEDVCSYLHGHCPAMLGLHIAPESKHAVIYTGGGKDRYCFINNKHESSASEPEELRLSEKELLSRLDETVTVGVLEKIEPVPIELRPYLERSLKVLHNLEKEIAAFCSQEQTPGALEQAMDRLFRPVLLDGVTMLELLEEAEIVAALKEVRTQFLDVVREGQAAILTDRLDMPLLNGAVTQYETLIMKYMEENTTDGE